MERSEELDRNKEAVCTLSRRDRRRAETRERLYSAAIGLLSQVEYDSVTVEMITEAADVGKGTFFNYFRNKDAVVSYHFDVQLRMLTEALQAERPAQAPAASRVPSRYAPREGGPFWRKIVGLVHESAARRDKEKHLTRTLLSLSLTNPEVRQANVRVRRRTVETMRGLIADAQEQGEIRDDVSADTLAEVMFGAYLGALYMWSQSDSNESLHDAVDRAYAHVWSGICPAGSRAAESEADEGAMEKDAVSPPR
ncbi:MAG TPA: TetR/AcrR family transcriptional regulator [Chthonomonadaceae bacterium]|nr:TetR/AcrR family transcriptional regulator [Chthonomonadaceae bacterium]